MNYFMIGAKVRKRYYLILSIVLSLFFNSGCDYRYGFIESEFQLSTDSRLPRWIKVEPKYSRSDITVTLTFYTLKKVKIKVYGTAPDGKLLLEKVGTNQWHPNTEKKFKERGRYDIYPNYLIITVDGIEEIFEQKKPEPILYVFDQHGRD